MARKWSNEQNLKFVELYRQQESLWNIKSISYRNRDMRSTALQNICDLMNIEGLTKDEVKSKIKALRSTYYLELDKIEKSSRSGAGGNVYVPKVPWFTELHEFIKDTTIKRKTKDNYTNPNSHEDEPINVVPARPSLQDQENEQPAPENEVQSTTPVQAPRSKRSKLSQMATIMSDMRKMHESLNDKAEDDIDIFGMSVASQMKKLSEEQAIIARDEIQSILTRCKLTDIRLKNYDYNRVLLPNTQFLRSTGTCSATSSSLGFYPNNATTQANTLIQLPQRSPAATSSTTSSSLGFYPNNATTQANTLIQLPQRSPAATSSTTSSSLGFYPNNATTQANTLIQLPQNSPAATSSTTSSSLGFHPNNATIQANTLIQLPQSPPASGSLGIYPNNDSQVEMELFNQNSTTFGNIIEEAFDNA